MVPIPTRRAPRALLGLIGLLAASLAPPAADAQRLRYQFGAPGAGLPGQGEYGADVLAPAQVEACLRRWREIDAMADAMERDQARVEALEAELAASQPAAQGRGRMPRGMAAAAAPQPAASPAAAQQAAAERQAKTEALNAERRRYLEAVERYRAAAEGFNLGCALRRYYEADMQAAQARLGAATR